MASAYSERYVHKKRFSPFLILMKWFAKFKLWMNPPKKGEVYHGDNFDFLIGKPMEQILHGLRDKNGNPIYNPAFGEGSYKVTILLDCMPYYVLECDSLVYENSYSNNRNDFRWVKRTQNRRIPKNHVIEMILDGRLKKV
jgi:hypothetical protein